MYYHLVGVGFMNYGKKQQQLDALSLMMLTRPQVYFNAVMFGQCKAKKGQKEQKVVVWLHIVSRFLLPLETFSSIK